MVDVLHRLLSPLLVCIAATIVWSGCDTLTTPGLETTSAPERDTDRLLQTEALAYELETDGFGPRVDIPYTFTNRTGGSVFLANCRGGFGLHLEREVDGVWQTAWGPVLLLCLSPPIVIEENATFVDTLRVVAGEFGSNNYPQFDVEDPTGVYRIVWTAALSSFDANASPFGPEIPLEYRISNRFALRR